MLKLFYRGDDLEITDVGVVLYRIVFLIFSHDLNKVDTV